MTTENHDLLENIGKYIFDCFTLRTKKIKTSNQAAC